MTIPQRSWLTLNMTSDQPDPNGRWPRELEVFVATSNVLKCCNSYWCNFYDGTLGMTNPPKTTGYVVFLWVLWMFCCLSIYRKKKKKTLAPQCSTKDWVQKERFPTYDPCKTPKFLFAKDSEFDSPSKSCLNHVQELKHHFGWGWLHAVVFSCHFVLEAPRTAKHRIKIIQAFKKDIKS